MKIASHPFALAAAFATVVAFAPGPVEARGGGSGHVVAGAGWHGGPARGGYYRGGAHRGGYYRGGHRGYWPGAFWGGIGLGLGVGAIAYHGGYYGGYYGPYYAPYYSGYYYDEPIVVAPAYRAVPVDPDTGARVGQPVPQAARAADPIFYPKNGQDAATAESDRRECNRWATTQAGAMTDASIFQRATLACMEGRGYTVR